MGGNVGIQMCLKDLDEGRNLLHGAILLAPMVTIKKEMKPPQVHTLLTQRIVCVCFFLEGGVDVDGVSPNELGSKLNQSTNTITPRTHQKMMMYQVLIDLLKRVAPIFPTLPVSPTPDVLEKVNEFNFNPFRVCLFVVSLFYLHTQPPPPLTPPPQHQRHRPSAAGRSWTWRAATPTATRSSPAWARRCSFWRRPTT